MLKLVISLLLLIVTLVPGATVKRPSLETEFPHAFQMQIVLFQDGSCQFSLNPDPLRGDARTRNDYLRWENASFHGRQAQVVTFHILSWKKDRILEFKKKAGIELNAFPLFEGATERKNWSKAYPGVYELQIVIFNHRNPRIMVNPNPIDRMRVIEKALVGWNEDQIDQATGEECTVYTLYFSEWNHDLVRQFAQLVEQKP